MRLLLFRVLGRHVHRQLGHEVALEVAHLARYSTIILGDVRKLVST